MSEQEENGHIINEQGQNSQLEDHVEAQELDSQAVRDSHLTENKDVKIEANDQIAESAKEMKTSTEIPETNVKLSQVNTQNTVVDKPAEVKQEQNAVIQPQQNVSSNSVEQKEVISPVHQQEEVKKIGDGFIQQQQEQQVVASNNAQKIGEFFGSLGKLIKQKTLNDIESLKNKKQFSGGESPQRGREQGALDAQPESESIVTLCSGGAQNLARSKLSQLSRSPPPKRVSEREKMLAAVERKRKLQEKLQSINNEISQIENQIEQKIVVSGAAVAEKKAALKARVEASQSQESQVRAAELVRRLNEEKREKERRRIEEQQRVLKVREESVERERLRQEEDKQVAILERRRMIAQRLEEQKNKHKERAESDRRANELLRELKARPEIAEVQQHVPKEVTELEKRKRELALKRQMYRPVLTDETAVPPPRSNFTLKILEEERARKEREIREEQDKRDMLERRKKYGKIVKDLYAPKVNTKMLQQALRAEEGAQDAGSVASITQLPDDQGSVQATQQHQSSSSDKKYPITTRTNNKNYNVARARSNGRSVDAQSLPPVDISTGFSNNGGARPQGNIPPQQASHGGISSASLEQRKRAQQVAIAPNKVIASPVRSDINGEDNTKIDRKTGISLPEGVAFASKRGSNAGNSRARVFKNLVDELPPLAPKKQQQPNYLAEVRRKRQEQEAQNPLQKRSEWEAIQQNKQLDDKEKYEHIIQATNKIESSARLKEQKAHILQDTKLNEEVDSLYIESIKAKLSLLDGMQTAAKNSQ